jgi:hypothetical protein
MPQTYYHIKQDCPDCKGTGTIARENDDNLRNFGSDKTLCLKCGGASKIFVRSDQIKEVSKVDNTSYIYDGSCCLVKSVIDIGKDAWLPECSEKPFSEWVITFRNSEFYKRTKKYYAIP